MEEEPVEPVLRDAILAGVSAADLARDHGAIGARGEVSPFRSTSRGVAELATRMPSLEGIGTDAGQREGSTQPLLRERWDVVLDSWPNGA